MLMKSGKLASVFLLLLVISVVVACSKLYPGVFTETAVRDFLEKAQAAEIKYSNEPEAGKANPFPASFVITGKVLILDKTLDYKIPIRKYKEFSFSDYPWFSEDPEEIRYVVLVEPLTGDSIIYTIVDLSYNEKVYKGIASSYVELAEILRNLAL